MPKRLIFDNTMSAPGEQRAGRLGRNASTICSGCGSPGTRQLGFDRYCDGCLEELLGPIREKVNAGNAFNGVGVGTVRADGYAPGHYHLTCDSCGAGWVGPRGEPCDWCAAAAARLIEDQRQLLLWPDWLTIERGPRYDELDADSRAVWDRTRGQTSGASAKAAWIERLVRAVRAGLITLTEAEQAGDRYDEVFGNGDQ